ncbi:outer membrane beta-barrel family protein [Terrimonas pollutisoli]|uniref:outer membrane beta-barrel family protein n=1 Tax=Terrimonas pollutisoli TaxID=3034147 RepID=UPI0023EB866D|nr:outer membrane beta-barrel family protein [Terrimonas sp. H1YJ31]
MKFFSTLLVFHFFSLTIQAQIDREQQHGTESSAIKINTSRLYGKLIDKNTGKPISAASVQLFIANKDSIITGMLSKANGDFELLDIPANQDLKIVISAIGFEPYEQAIEGNSVRRGRGNLERDLGNIAMEPNIQVLGGVTIVSNKPVMELAVDRKVYNVAKSFTATGGTAIDVMKNIPSLKVDIDGNVQLRNSSPQIFIDGRPTILTLDQIPADNIEKVELVTNPSAKFDAASSGGIINIVLKKNKRIGLNGIISASVGTPKILNSNLNLNLRQGKFNFFAIGGYNQSGGKARGETKRQNKTGGAIQDYFNQVTTNNRLRRFQSLRFGTDYFIDNRNTLSLTQDFGKGRFRNREEQEQQYLDQNETMQYYGNRFANGRSTFRRRSTRLSYKHSFPQASRELTADITYNYGKNTENSNIDNIFLNPDGSTYKPSSKVRNEGSGRNEQFTFQADYIHPFNEETKLETGIRSFQNESRSFYNAFAVDNALETKLPLSNNYKYRETVNALYATYSGKKKTFSYQFGFRAEVSKFTGTLIDSAFKFGYEYPAAIKNIWDAIFPSMFLAKQIGENDQLQFNYSRRIRRPNFWQINPFIDINDPVNLRQGNPQLRPEFINSFEFNYSKDYKNGNFLASVYFRNNPDDITQYSDTITAAQYEQLQNAGIDPNAILNTFINAGITNRYGAEFVVQHKQGKNFTITPSFDFQYRTVKAEVKELDLSNDGFSWEAQLTTDYKIETNTKSIFNNLGFQLMGEYESAEVIPQGRRKPEYGVDFAMRKDFLKNNKATITFGINDIFNTQRWGTIYDTEIFYQDSYRRWNVRNFRVTFSYKFGKADFSLSRRNERGGGGEDD